MPFVDPGIRPAPRDARDVFTRAGPVPLGRIGLHGQLVVLRKAASVVGSKAFGPAWPLALDRRPAARAEQLDVHEEVKE